MNNKVKVPSNETTRISDSSSGDDNDDTSKDPTFGFNNEINWNELQSTFFIDL